MSYVMGLPLEYKVTRATGIKHYNAITLIYQSLVNYLSIN